VSHLFQFNQHDFLLLPEKAIYWEAEKTIIIADLHLGKAGHFRKEGLAIPMESIEKDYLILKKLITNFKPSRILILGDLFHSNYNLEWEKFGKFIKENASIKFELIIGNHDILPAEMYQKIGIVNLGISFIFEKLIFTHHPLTEIPAGSLNFSGHIHPGIQIEGKGRQKITMPCFFKKKNNFILPAFGSLTGLKILQKDSKTEIFGISGSKIFNI
jgi:uncharacterized protein